MDKIYCTKGLNNIYDSKDWAEIINDFQPKINYNLHKVPPQERDDLEQEIKIKIIEKMSMLLDDKKIEGNLPSFWDYLDKQKRYKH